MARKNFQLVFPDGSKKHIGTAARDRHLAALEIERVDETTFRFVGDPKPKYVVLHTMQELGSLKNLAVSESLLGPKFQEGSFIWEHKGKRSRELFETVTGMVCRMAGGGVLNAGR